MINSSLFKITLTLYLKEVRESYLKKLRKNNMKVISDAKERLLQ